MSVVKLRHVDRFTDRHGRLPFTAKGFSNFMADKIGEAGLPERCVTHGLRKAAARRLAEAGCSANEIASITGHVTLEEVARYTKAAEQKKLARAAIGRLAGGEASGIGFPNLPRRFGKEDEKSNEFSEDLAKWRPVGRSNSRNLSPQVIDTT